MKKLLVLGLGAFALMLSGCTGVNNNTPVTSSEEPSSSSEPEPGIHPAEHPIKPNTALPAVLAYAVMYGSYEIELVFHGESDTYVFFGVKYTEETDYVSYCTVSTALTDWNLDFDFYARSVYGSEIYNYTMDENSSEPTAITEAQIDEIFLARAFAGQEYIPQDVGGTQTTFRTHNVYVYTVENMGEKLQAYCLPAFWCTVGLVHTNPGEEGTYLVDLNGINNTNDHILYI